MKANYILLILMLVSLVSCSVDPKPIDYGKDVCDYCEMTIVDNKYGAEIVNTKGKVFKFDAAECLLRFIAEGSIKEDEIALSLITSVDKPNILTEAEVSYYLISENLPSPMGAFLTSFDNEKSANKYQKKYGGKIYNWTKLKTVFNEPVEYNHSH